MKLIFSKKGYDDQYGGYPSIILPEKENYEMLSFPIPAGVNEIGVKSENLNFKNKNLKEIFTELNHKNTSINHHYDPAINHRFGNIKTGIFGQSGSSAGHLRNQNITKGDIFLFFGTYNYVRIEDNLYKYEKCWPFHAIWGYLIVDKVLNNRSEIEAEADLLKNHPHFQNIDLYNNDIVYYGNNFGHFNYSDNLRLTKIGYKKTIWSLPIEFHSKEMTYHSNIHKVINDNKTEFQIFPKVQEIVVKMDDSLKSWTTDIISHKNNGG